MAPDQDINLNFFLKGQSSLVFSLQKWIFRKLATVCLISWKVVALSQQSLNKSSFSWVHKMPLTALFLFVPIVLANRMPLDLPPHCSSEGLMESEMRTFGSNFSSAENANEIWWSTHLKMSLNDTACFFIKVRFEIFKYKQQRVSAKQNWLEHYSAHTKIFKTGTSLFYC